MHIWRNTSGSSVETFSRRGGGGRYHVIEPSLQWKNSIGKKPNPKINIQGSAKCVTLGTKAGPVGNSAGIQGLWVLILATPVTQSLLGSPSHVTS